jgi:small subunit ribosomal protein S16
VAVAIRMKRMGRKNRAFFRICATDRRSPRDGRVIEVLGTYDPSVPDTDARCLLDGERVNYWLSVGAQPSDAVRVLVKKYGHNGTHLKAMELARAKLSMPRIIPEAGEPVFVPEPKFDPKAAAAAAAAAETVVATPAAEASAPAEAAPQAVADAPLPEATDAVVETASPAAEAGGETQPEQA